MTHQDDLISEIRALRAAVAALAERGDHQRSRIERPQEHDDRAVMRVLEAHPNGCPRNILSRATQALGAQRRDAAVARLMAAQRVTAEKANTRTRPATILRAVTHVTCAGDQRLTPA